MEGSATEEPKIIRRPAGMSDDEDYNDDGDIIIEVEEDIWDDDDETQIPLATNIDELPKHNKPWPRNKQFDGDRYNEKEAE